MSCIDELILKGKGMASTDLYKEVLDGVSITDIVDLIKETQQKNEFTHIYDYLCKKFIFLPIGFIDSSIDPDIEPLRAYDSVRNDVDGSKGFRTYKTPQAITEFYIRMPDLECITKEKLSNVKSSMISNDHYDYVIKWKKESIYNCNCKVTGDVLFSFPKRRVFSKIEEHIKDYDKKKRHDVLEQIDLLARLNYTIGNFMPMPKLGKGLKSLNSIHSYGKKGKAGFDIERMDCFLIKLLTDDTTRRNCESFFKTLDDVTMNQFINNNYLCMLTDGTTKVLDLTTFTYVSDYQSISPLTADNIFDYFLSACAVIIARGNMILNSN